MSFLRWGYAPGCPAPPTGMQTTIYRDLLGERFEASKVRMLFGSKVEKLKRCLRMASEGCAPCTAK